MERDIANFDAMEVANALVSVSVDKRQFSSKLRGKGSVWNLAVLKLLPHKSKLKTTIREEFLVFQAWNNNINYIQRNYELIRGKLTGGRSGFTQQEQQVRDRNACICELQTPTSDKDNRIQCFFCERRLHFFCANVHPETSTENFLCDFCCANLVEPEFLTIDPTWNADERDKATENNPFSSVTIDHRAETVSQPNKSVPVPDVDTDLPIGQHGSKTVSSDSNGKGDIPEDASGRSQLDMDCDNAEVEDDMSEGAATSNQHYMDCDDDRVEDDILEGVTDTNQREMDCDDDGVEDDILEGVTDTNQREMDCDDPEIENKYPAEIKLNQLNANFQSTEKTKNDKEEVDMNCKPENDNDSAEHDTSEIPTSFTFVLPSTQYSSVNRQNDGTFGNRRSDFVAPRGWTNIVARHFNKTNPFCTLSFLGHVFEPSNSNATFFKGYAFCKNKPNCTAHWSFKIEEFQQTPIDCEVKVALTSGSIKHLKGDTCRRQLAFQEREETAIRLKHQTAFLENKTRFANADSKLLTAGNLTEVPKVSVLRNLKCEANAQEDLDKDVFRDLNMTAKLLMEDEDFSDTHIPGYVQGTSSIPHQVLMYSKRQMLILKELVKKSGKIALQMDATGTLVKPLPEPYDIRSPYLYTIIVRSPFGTCPLPVAELITSDNTYGAISKFLKFYFESLRRECRLIHPNQWIEKVEIDFSDVLLMGLIDAFTHESLEEYLSAFWEYEMEGRLPKSNMLPIHICRFHVLKMFERRAKKEFGNQQEAINWFDLAAHRLTNCRSMAGFQRWLQDVGVVFGYKYKTAAVRARLQKKASSQSISELWKGIECNKAGSNLWERTEFGCFADYIFNIIRQQNEAVSNEIVAKSLKCDENNLYKPEMLVYLRDTVAPYFPIVSHFVFELFRLNTTDDTTNAIECYQGIAKLQVYKDAKRRKVSRFIRRQSVVVKGLIKEMETNLGMKPPVKKVKLAEKAKVNEEIVDLSSSDEDDISDEPDWNSFQNVKIKPSSSRKRAKSPQSKDEVWGDKKSKRIKKTSPQQHFMECVPLVLWGGEYDGVEMKNTCAIDSIMNAFIGLLHANATFKKFVGNQKSVNVISKGAYQALTTCQEMNFNEGKKVWIKDVLQLDLTTLLNKNNNYDLAGSLDERGIYEVRSWFCCAMYTLCMNPICDNPATQSKKFSTLQRQDWKEVNLFSMIYKTQEEWLSQFAHLRESRESCLFCHEQKHSILSAISDRPWIMYHLASTATEFVTEDKLLRIQKVGDQNYKVFAFIVIEGESDPISNTLPHFVCKFIVDDIIIRYDGMSKSRLPEIETSPSNGKLEYIILVPENT